MHYTIYKISNKIDGKIYIGSHKTENLDDTYMGSGKYLKRAQEKYGIDNFIKEILFVFNTPEEMYAKEAELVNEDFLAMENTYNLKVGGFGGFEYINLTKSLEERSKSGVKSGLIHASRLVNDMQYRYNLIERFTSMTSLRHSLGEVKYSNFKGKSHSLETKNIISDKVSVAQRGSKNSQYGTMWITNEKDNMKIPKDGIIPSGWRKGRKIKGK